MVFLKVMTVICRASRPLLHLSDVFVETGQIEQLIRTVVVSRNIYVRRALICLVQDFLTSEAKCDNARNASARAMGGSSAQTLIQGLGSESSGASVESELESRAGVQSAPAATMEQSSSAVDQNDFNEVVENMAKQLAKHVQEKHTAAAAAAASGSATTSKPSDFGQWMKSVETPNGAQQYIECWVDAIKPLQFANSKVSEEKRQQRLRDL